MSGTSPAVKTVRDVARAGALMVVLVIIGACTSGREARPSVTARDPTLLPYESTGWRVTVFYLGSSDRYGGTLTEGGDYILGLGADGVTVARVGDALLVETAPGSAYYYEVDASEASARYQLPGPAQVRALLAFLGSSRAPTVGDLQPFATIFAGGVGTVRSVEATGGELVVGGTRSTDGRPFEVALLRVEKASFDLRASRQRVAVEDENVAALLTGER